MKIVNCGYDYVHEKGFEVNRPYGSGDYMLLLLRSATRHNIGGEWVTDGGDSVIIYKKGTPHHYFGEDKLVNDWVHFEVNDGESSLFRELGLPFETFIHLTSVSKLSSIIRRMSQEFYSSSKHSGESSELYLRLFLLKLSELMLLDGEQTNSSEIYHRFSKLRDRIYANPQIRWSVGELSSELSFSLSYFQHKWREFFGTSAKRDITAARMEYAKYLLFSTTYGVSTVSAMCGYENDVHFMRAFKQQTGQTPTEYRLENLHAESLNEAKKKHHFAEHK